MAKKRLPYGIYSRGLREEAIKLVLESGFSAKEAGRQLSISDSTIRYWLKAHKEGELSSVGKAKKTLSETELELARVKRELAEVKMERDLLKKAAAYFAKGSLPGTR
jgi:transposase